MLYLWSRRPDHCLVEVISFAKHAPRISVVKGAKGLAVMRTTDRVAWVQEGEFRGPSIDFEVLLLMRRTDLEFCTMRCLSQIPTQ
jgi:hypothetical protein